MKNILLLGGTGAIGANITSLPVAPDWEFYVTSRRKRGDKTSVRYVMGDAQDEAFLQGVLEKNFDVIIDFMIYRTEDFVRRLPKFLSSCSQYIFLSSARVYASSEEPITENTPRLLDVNNDIEFLEGNDYALKKARQEDFLFNSGKRNWTIIRPYITYGRERLQLGVLEKEAWLYRALNGRSVVFSEDMLKCQTTLTGGSDVARAMVKLIGEPSALGEAFHITGANHLTWEAVLGIYRRAMEECGLQFKVQNVDLDSFISCHNGKYQIIYDRLYNRVFDNSKISKFIDVHEFESVEEGLYQSAIDFLHKPHFLKIDWPHEAVKDRLTGDRAKLREMGNLKNKLRYIKYRFI